MTWNRIFTFGFQNFLRNGWLSVVTVSMLIFTLLTVNILLVVQRLAATSLTAVEDRIDVTVYFKNETSEDILSGAQGALAPLSQVREVVRVSSEEALARFTQRHQGETEVLAALEEVGDNPFGPSLVVRARSAADFPFILKALENPAFASFIDQRDFQDYAEVVQNIERVSRSVGIFGLVLAAMFLLISTLIVMNTIRVAIYIYREEISIMRLVGASSMFIRAPFWFEAVLYSLIATALTAGLVFVSVGAFERVADRFFAPANTDLLGWYLVNGLLIFGMQFIVLAVINIASASMAMRKYLKV